MQGWIKLHRAVMKSETFSKLTAIQQLIAIYIILNANHEDGIWYDKYKDIEVPIKRGQLVVSRNKIANEWFKGDKEITEQKVRTTLKKLEKLSFLTITPTNSYTLLEVRGYNVYQAREDETNQASNQETTKSQPRDNQVSTTNKNVKNDKNEKKEIKNSRKQVFDDTHYQLSLYFLEQIRKNNPDHKQPNLDTWSNDIRLMMVQDKRTEEQIKYLMKWVQEDSFECTNVLSPSKLRKRYDQLVMKVKQEKAKEKTPVKAGRSKEDFDLSE